MKILCFAAVAEITGHNEISLESAGTIEELKQKLQQKYPRIANLNYAVAVNQTIATTNQSLSNTDEIALLPPFSGG